MVEAAGDASLLAEPTCGGAQMVDPAADAGEVGFAGQVVQGHLPSKPDFDFIDEDLGYRIEEVVVSLPGEDRFPFLGPQLCEQLRGVDEEKPQTADGDAGGAVRR